MLIAPVLMLCSRRWPELRNSRMTSALEQRHGTLHKYKNSNLVDVTSAKYNSLMNMAPSRESVVSFTSTKGLLNGPGQNNCFLNSAVQVSKHVCLFSRRGLTLSRCTPPYHSCHFRTINREMCTPVGVQCSQTFLCGFGVYTMQYRLQRLPIADVLYHIVTNYNAEETAFEKLIIDKLINKFPAFCEYTSSFPCSEEAASKLCPGQDVFRMSLTIN